LRSNYKISTEDCAEYALMSFIDYYDCEDFGNYVQIAAKKDSLSIIHMLYHVYYIIEEILEIIKIAEKHGSYKVERFLKTKYIYPKSCMGNL
jgi:hypothetical protein